MSTLQLGPVQVDLLRHEVVGPSGQHPLSAQEVALLAYLAERRGTAVPRAELLQAVWGYHPTAAMVGQVDVHRALAAVARGADPTSWLTAARRDAASAGPDLRPLLALAEAAASGEHPTEPAESLDTSHRLLHRWLAGRSAGVTPVGGAKLP